MERQNSHRSDSQIGEEDPIGGGTVHYYKQNNRNRDDGVLLSG
jgi:hypothetical protein